LRARTPGNPYVGMHSRDLLQVVVDQGYDALIINAAGSWAGVPREDIVRILEGVWSEKRA
jgi:L-asparaginase/Glu-tRNA(Gln) amidotransferase subunit D